MINTAFFTLRAHDIKVKKLGEPIFLIPFGDIHFGTKNCSVSRFKEHVEYYGKDNPNCYFIGMGDYQDCVSGSERQMLSKPFHETTIDKLDEVYIRICDELVDIISWMKGKLIGLIEGNHYAELQDGTTTTMRMAKALECAYLGVMTNITLRFDYRGARTAFEICAHHGKGAARLAGSSLNTVINLAEGHTADLYMMGHDHKRGAVRGAKIHSQSHQGVLRARHRPQAFCRTGGFLRAYENGEPSYVAEKALNPADLGGIVIELTPRRTKEDGLHVKMRVIT